MRQGIDVASFQHPGGVPIDYAAVVASGVTWVAVKITEGMSYINPWAGQDCRGFAAAGATVVPYHFAQPHIATATDQASFFFTSCPFVAVPATGALDLEVTGGAEWRELAAWTEAFRVASGVDLLYVNRSFQRGLGSVGYSWPGRLWLAAPSENVFPAEAHVWQYATTDVPGIGALCDVDQVDDNPGDDMPLNDDDKAWIAEKVSTIAGDSRAEVERFITQLDGKVDALAAQVAALPGGHGGPLNVQLSGTATPAPPGP